MRCAHWTTVADQKQETDVIGRIARAAGFVLLVSLLFPGVRRTLAGLGFWGVVLSLLIVVGLLGFGIYRLSTWTARMKAANENPFAPPTDDADPISHHDEPEATLELFGPALRRRYPWRH
jgi:hypothetical protein